MKRKFTGNTRLYLCISGAIIVIALIMQIAGAGMNLGIDFTGGSILSYSVGENYDVNDVETILNAAGFTENQVTKAAPSVASIELQKDLAEQAAAEAEAPAEEAAEVEEAAEEAAETEAPAEGEAAAEAAEAEAPAEDAAEAEEAPAEEETFVPMLNLDKAGIADDGMTDLQIRLKLVDASKGMEDTIQKAVQGVAPGASQSSYRIATNLEVSDLGYDLSYAGGYIVE